jgi:hypothetical protein
MLSHDPVRTRLREALEHSAAGKFLRGARAFWADSWSHGRPPTKAEIRGLEQRGNTGGTSGADWTGLRILGTGPLTNVRGCRFEGHVILRPGKSLALRDSRIRDCLIGAATVESVALLDRVIVDDGAALRHVGACTGLPDSRFCLGLAVHPGSETGARRVFLADGLLLADCAAMAALPPAEQDALALEWKARLRHRVSDYAYVGAGARVEHARFVEDCFVGPGAVIRGAAALRRCIVGSTGADPVHLGDNVIAEDCVLEAGARLESGAQARRALFLEHSGAEQGGHVADSVIGPNTAIAKGEVTASLLGPFTGFHHQALLIGALWPEGRGNVGYGANVGSNHTGRKPDQELRPGEGAFFGLGCAIKFPADFSRAPYSLFATGVITPPQKIAFPFSLITTGDHPDHPGRNEILPGWMWGENAYALIRNAYKYADRNRAKNHSLPEAAPPQGSPLTGTFLAADLFAPRVAACVTDALASLGAKKTARPAGKNATVTGKEIAGLGMGFARADRLEKARDAYENYLAFVSFRQLLWDAAPPKKPANVTGKAPGKTPDAKRLFLELGAAVESSLRRDTERGMAVFPDYADFHEDAAKDAVCRRLKADLDALLPVLRERLAALP